MIEWFFRYVASWLGLIFVMAAFSAFGVLWWAVTEIRDRIWLSVVRRRNYPDA
jgi:hypothetical protein